MISASQEWRLGTITQTIRLAADDALGNAKYASELREEFGGRKGLRRLADKIDRVCYERNGHTAYLLIQEWHLDGERGPLRWMERSLKLRDLPLDQLMAAKRMGL